MLIWDNICFERNEDVVVSAFLGFALNFFFFLILRIFKKRKVRVGSVDEPAEP